jgi:hypothetical protein
MMNKHTIRGKKGDTICYTCSNLRLDDGKIKWDAFRFYTPVGTLIDDDGYKYYDVPADEVPIQRDPMLKIELIIVVTQNSGVEAYEVPVGAEGGIGPIGLEGDIIVTAVIPSAPDEEIICDYKEVTNG